MKLRLSLICLVFLTLLTSCAYYNTFYNTKKLFKEARKERENRQGDKPSSAELNKYDLTIEKASKILEIYPNSKYVDDAVFMLGECFYYKEDFIKAKRKFEELTSYFPDSDYFYKGKLWLAKSNIQLKDYLAARFILLEIIDTRKINKDIRDESQLLLGEVQFEQTYYEEAGKEFKQVANNSNNKDIKARAFFKLGLCQVNTENYSLAVRSFNRALKYSTTKQFAFNAELNLAKALKLSGDFQDSKKVSYGLLDNDSFKDKHGLVKLEIADCIYREGKSLYKQLKSADLSYLGKVDEALDEYKKITLEYKRTDNAAKAYFQMAKIYEEDFGDFPKAKEYYDKVKLEFNKSELLPEATKKSKIIGDLIRIKNLVKKSQGIQLSEDGNNEHTMTALELLLWEHGVHPELRFMKKQKLLAKSIPPSENEIQNKPAEQAKEKSSQNADLDALVTNKLQLAEVYMLEFGQIDSALKEYNEIIEFFPDHPGTAKALFSIAFIYENEFQNKFKTDSLLYVLVERFPDTFQSKSARKLLGLPAQISQSEEAAELYKYAENTLFTRKNINQALFEFQQVLEIFPNSEFAPKALYAKGWIYEHITFENERAFEIYKDILNKYPKSEYAKTVKKKIDAVEEAAAKQEAEKLNKAEQDTLDKNIKLKPEISQQKQKISKDIQPDQKNNEVKELDFKSANKVKNKLKKPNP